MITGGGFLAIMSVSTLIGGGTERLEATLVNYGAGGNERAEKLLEEGIGLKKAGNLEQAEVVLQRVIREYPNATYEDVDGKRRYSDHAREYLAGIACLKRRGIDQSSGSPEELIGAIKTAYLSKQTNSLARLGSCDFVVGLAESDAVWAMSPEDAVPAMMILLTKEDWESAFSDFAGRGKGDFMLQLENVSGKWIWKGFFTSNRKVLDSLWKIHKQRKRK